VSDDNKTKSDKAPDAPLEKSDVKEVRVKPRDSDDPAQRKRNSQSADKARDAVRKDVDRAVEGGSSGGPKEQIKRIEKALDEASRQVNPNSVERIKVKVRDKAGRETEIVRHPGEGTETKK